VTGWGFSLSSNINVTKHDVFRFQTIYGAGIQNYFNDAPVDVGIKKNFSNPRKPVTGEALPIFGLSAYIDHGWGGGWTSALGYSRVDIDNSDAQAPSAFRIGQYSSVNLLWAGVPNVMMGGELQWARRDNFSDGFSSDDFRLQFTFKYSFSQHIGGKP
jgi:hypothetical protein